MTGPTAVEAETDTSLGLSLLNRGTERPADAGWVLVGTLDGHRPARVDGGGLVSPHGGRWSLDWWVGAEDRWHLPAREPAVRQQRVGSGPVIETAVRIPSGDARQVVYGALVGGQEVTVVEVTNDSPTPVAVAFALRPCSVTGEGAAPVAGAQLRIDDQGVWAGPELVLGLPRQPNQLAISDDDLVDVVTGGGDLPDFDTGPTVGDASAATTNAVVIYPVPHRTSIRVLLPAAGVSVDQDRVPESDAVSRGWNSLLDRGARCRFPDPGLTALHSGARARLLLAAPTLGPDLEQLAPGAGQVLAGLVIGGHDNEAMRLIAELARTFPVALPGSAAEAAAVAHAIGSAHILAERQPEPATVELVAQLAHLVDRSKADGADRATVRRALAQLARADGDTAGSEHLEAEAAAIDGREGDERGGDGQSVATPHRLVAELVAAASPAGAWGGGAGDDARAAARFVAAARDALIDDGGSDLVLLPTFPTAWRGGEVEVHRAPSAYGRVSFAIRWHGYRPALLWDIEGLRGQVRCPSLDPDWSSTEPRGETLLAGSSEGLPAPPAQGDSFS